MRMFASRSGSIREAAPRRSAPLTVAATRAGGSGHAHDPIAANTGLPAIAHDFTRLPVDPVPRGVIQPKLNDGASHSPRPAHIGGENRTGMPDALKAGLESLSGVDLSGVRVHRNSSSPDKLNAHAYAQGSDIHLAPGQERHLPHEAWHVVQQMQGRARPTGHRIGDVSINADPALESEADRMGARALAGQAHAGARRPQTKSWAARGGSWPVQRAVRVGGGATRVNEADYNVGGPRAAVGTRFLVRDLIADNARRVFNDVTEMESYANGSVDYIGDVRPSNAAVAPLTGGSIWYRLNPNEVTVLGEAHHNANGNVEDVIAGLRTSRFMYEPFNAVSNVAGQSVPFTGTQARLTTLDSSIQVAGQVDRANFNPDLENLVIKVMGGSALGRDEYLLANPRGMRPAARARWQRRPSNTVHRDGERAALYIAMGIHLAADLAAQSIPAGTRQQRRFIQSEQALARFYLQNQAVLDLFMNTKDNDDLIALDDLVSPNNFQNLAVMRRFTALLHQYCARYVEQLGADTGNTTLRNQGRRLAGRSRVGLDDVSPAREEVMWDRLQQAIAGRYLIVGMGDAHRQNLTRRMNAMGIVHMETESSLRQQRDAVNSAWVP